MFQDVDQLRQAIRNNGLQRLEDEIVAIAEPSVKIVHRPISDEQIPVGASKLGGFPDLPTQFEWPYWGSIPLTFIGQFRLSALHSVYADPDLPPSGMLYFFFEADQVPWGEWSQREGWKLIYVEDEAQTLVRTPHPEFQGKYKIITQLKSHAVDYLAKVSLPNPLDGLRYNLKFSDVVREIRGIYDKQEITEGDIYYEMLDTADPEPRHHFFGCPWCVQNNVEEYCEGDSQNRDDVARGNTLQRIEGKQVLRKWKFIFQIDSDNSLDIIWHDMGTVYVCIPRLSLANRRFEDTWIAMQCY